MGYFLSVLLLITTHFIPFSIGSVATSPPLGWMTGERYACNVDCTQYPDDCISEKLVTRTIVALQQNKMTSLGFKYLLLSDCWMAKSRDHSGNLQVDPDRFPNGIKGLIQKVHAAGLKLGVYLSLGNETQNGYPGTQGHKQQDATTLASWGVDMVYADAVNVPVDALTQAYTDFAGYVHQSGREMLLACMLPYYQISKGRNPDWATVSRICNTFRVYDDMIDSWESLHDVLKHFGDDGAQYVNHSGPGHWADPGQLLVGDFGLSENQQEMQLAVWSVMAAPLFVSADLTSLSVHARSLLTNKLALAINQDPLGIMGSQKAMIGQVRIWLKPITPAGSFAMALLYENISGGPNKVSLKLQDLGFTTAAAYNFTDVISGQHVGVYKPWYTFNVEVNPTGVKFIHALALP